MTDTNNEKDELALQQQGQLVHVIQNTGLGEVLKPLTREIHLFDTYVAGTTYLEDKAVLKEIKLGQELTLQREDNRYDEKAILVLTKEGKKLGYVPEKDNVIFSRLMDAGKYLTARIENISRDHGYVKIEIRIYLVDF